MPAADPCMSEDQALPGGEAALADHGRWRNPTWRRPGVRLLGSGLHRHRLGPRVVTPNSGCPAPCGLRVLAQALGATIRRAATATAPRAGHENGIATDDDTQRIAFVRQALDRVLDCLAEGVDVRGYTYWSLLDNFEWAHGYRPTFGLVAVDRTTQARTPKPSATWLGQVARSNTLA